MKITLETKLFGNARQHTVIVLDLLIYMTAFFIIQWMKIIFLTPSMYHIQKNILIIITETVTQMDANILIETFPQKGFRVADIHMSGMESVDIGDVQ